MPQKYKLYDILFEKVDLKARLAAMQKTKSALIPQPSPSGKIDMHPQQIMHGMQDQIKANLPVISKIVDNPAPEEADINAAKAAAIEVSNTVDAIAGVQLKEAIKLAVRAGLKNF